MSASVTQGGHNNKTAKNVKNVPGIKITLKPFYSYGTNTATAYAALA